MSGNRLTCVTKIIDGDVTLVEVAGEIDLNNSGRLRNYYTELRRAGSARFVFDFSRTEYIDSSGIGLLVFIYTSSRQRNIRVRFAGFTPPVRRLVRLTRLDSVLPLADTVDRAVAAVRGDSAPAGERVRKILVDGASPLFDPAGLERIDLRLQLPQVRRLSLLIAQKAPPDIRGVNLLEQQVCELLKNAVKHGHRCDPEKTVRIAYGFTPGEARLIVEDEGDGFKRIDEWNDFYRNKVFLHKQQDYDRLINYLSFRTERSDESDGGNALFAAVEYWNQGVVFNEKGNAVAVKRFFDH